MSVPRTPALLFAFILAALCAASPPSARAGNSAPAIAAFDTAFASVSDYTCDLHSHEAKGSRTQDRVYQYSFLKPHFVKTYIASGDGHGSGAVWTGGDTVNGHMGGFLSGIHMKVSLHDARATDLLGFTIPDGVLSNIVHTYVTLPGTLTQTPGGEVNGVMTDRLDLKLADPSNAYGITEQILYLSQATHFPVRQIIYSGQQIILDQTIDNLKTNVGLTPNDFPF